MTPRKIQAIQAALDGNWNEAITLNLALLKEDPVDIETLNRLGFAYTILNKAKEAKQIYLRVLNLDSKNPVALRNLKRLSSLDKKSSSLHMYAPIRSVNGDSLFIEESGKTKVIDLLNVAPPQILSHLMPGELITLRIKRLKVFALDARNQYIGMLPEDIGKRLLKFMSGGMEYQACIKAIDNRTVTIFIRESKRPSRFRNQLSFITTPSEKTKISFSNKSPRHPKEPEEESEEEES